MITRAAFIYLSTAYDTWNHVIIKKLYNTRHHTMKIFAEHAVQPKIKGGAEQQEKHMDKPEEWSASGQCSVTIVVQHLH